MNIEEIKEVVNSKLSEELKSKLIFSIIADDKDAIPSILKILNEERKKKEELILDSNAELSRALVVLKDENLKYNKNIIADPKWVVEEIIKHYKKWRGTIGCCFNIEELK